MKRLEKSTIQVGKRVRMMPALAFLMLLLITASTWWIWRGRMAGEQSPSVANGSGKRVLAIAENHSTKSSKQDRERVKREADRIRLLSEAQLKANEKQLAELAANPPLETIGPKGQLTTAAVEALGMSETEEQSLREAIGRVKEQARVDFISRMKVIETNKGKESVSTTYYVRARPDRGKGLYDSLSQESAAILSEPRSKKFMSGQGYGFFAKFGAYDVQLEVFERDGKTQVKHQFMSPKTGNVLREGQSDLSELKEEFGDLFEE